MGEGKWVVFMHRGAGSTIGCLVMALLRRPPVEGGRQTIIHVSVKARIDLKLGSHLSYTQLVQRFLLSLSVQGP